MAIPAQANASLIHTTLTLVHITVTNPDYALD